MTTRSLQRAIWWVMWPGFVAACVAEFIFFALFDPLDFNMRLQLSREAVYTWGFIAFWLLGILSSGITLLLGGPFFGTSSSSLRRAPDYESSDQHTRSL